MADTEHVCEGCGRTFSSPGLGRPRRYGTVCAPPRLPGLKLYSHGVTGPLRRLLVDRGPQAPVPQNRRAHQRLVREAP